MEDRDDLLLKQFLAPARKEIEDDGFTERVMQRLPERKRDIRPVWIDGAIFCTVAVLFVLMGGMPILLNSINNAFANLGYDLSNLLSNTESLRTLGIAVVLGIYVACFKALKHA